MWLLKLLSPMGIAHPAFTTICAAILGACLFGGIWWGVIQQAKNDIASQTISNAGIKVRGSTNVHMEGNIIHGYDNPIDIENSSNVTAKDNKALAPKNK